MVILILTYEKSLIDVDKYLEEHRLYLDKNYSAGNFLASGRKNPRTGGIILIKGNSKKAQELLQEDPFYIHGIARYDIIEFEPTKFAPGLEELLR